MAVTYSGSGIPGIGINSPAALAALPQATWKPTGAIPDYKTFVAQKPAMLGTMTQGPGFYGGNGAWQMPAPVYSNPQDKANFDAWQLWGHQNNIFPGSGGGLMETLSNKIIPAAIQGAVGTGLAIGGGGVLGVGPAAGTAAGSAIGPGMGAAGVTGGSVGTGAGATAAGATAAGAAGASALPAGAGAASGLGGASGAVGASTIPAGTGVAGGLTGASGAALGTGGLGTAVGAGSTLAGGVGLPGLVSGATTGSAAGGATGATGGTGGFSNFMNSVFGPGAAAPTATSLGAMGIGGALGQTVLDLWDANRRDQAANHAAGLADPFASQRPQYQAQLAGLMANPNSITQDPSYKFRLDQGQQALERSNVSRGFLGSGNMPIDLINYSQGAASQELGNQKNFLANLAGANVGNPGAAAGTYQQGTGNSISQTYQGLSGLGTLAGQIYKNYNPGSGAIY